MSYQPTSHQGTSHYHGSGYDSHGTKQGADYTKLGKEEIGEDYEKLKQYSKDKEKKDQKDVYQKLEEDESKKRGGKKDDLTKAIEKEEQKYKYNKKEGIDDEEIKRKAAAEIHSEVMKGKGEEAKKKNTKTIEEAIKKAIEEEKRVIRLDD